MFSRGRDKVPLGTNGLSISIFWKCKNKIEEMSRNFTILVHSTNCSEQLSHDIKQNLRKEARTSKPSQTSKIVFLRKEFTA